jgi:hypothetical protein
MSLDPRLFFLNPAAGAILNLFGLGAKQTKRGAKVSKGRTQKGQFDFADPLFTPEIFGRISDFLSGPISPGQAAAFSMIGRDTGGVTPDPGLLAALGGTQESLAGLLGAGRPTLSALLETGLPTDIAPITAARLRSFEQEFLPTIAEQLPGGIFSSAVPLFAGREAGNIQTELGALQFSAEEAARGRQLQALTQALPQFFGAEFGALGLPSAFAEQLLNVNELARGQEPEARLLSALEGLGGNFAGPQIIDTVNRPSSGEAFRTGLTSGALGGLGGLF